MTILRVGVLAAVLALMAVRNLPWHLEEKDQARQAFAALEVAGGGAVFFQSLPYGRPARKPPLAAWLTATCFAVVGDWEVAWRLPPLLAGLAIVVLLVRGGARTAGPLGALLALSVFGFNAFTPRLATLVRTDMLLAACVLGVGMLILRCEEEQRPMSNRSRVALGLLLAAGFFLKGPTILAFLLPGLLLHAWLTRRRRGRVFGWGSWWSWIAPLLLLGVWVGVGIATVPGFFRDVVGGDFLQRFAVGETGRSEASSVSDYVRHLGDYVFYLFVRCAPWTILMAGLVIADRDLRRALVEDPATRWLWCWIVGAIVFMSLVPSKRADRIYPIVPPLGLLMVHMGLRSRFRSDRALAALVLVAGVGWIAIGLSFVQLRYAAGVDAVARFGRDAQRLARANGWRVGVVPPGPEGLVCYLRPADSLDSEEARARWQRGELDALVLDSRRLPFPDARIVQITTARRGDRERTVLLIRRRQRVRGSGK